MRPGRVAVASARSYEAKLSATSSKLTGKTRLDAGSYGRREPRVISSFFAPQAFAMKGATA